ncbi:MAG: ABC transporter substrate-binding protein [Thermotogota bacterium]|nr:ABC transporter substrate-binding protein [Thermotogota bacterium]
MTKKLSIFLLVVFVFSVIAVGAVKNPDTFVNLSIGQPETFDPAHSYDTSSGAVIMTLYDNLIQYDGDSVNDFLPMIAETVPSQENGLWSEDGTVYTFPIRQGMTFHTGNPVTPEDVEYSFKRDLLMDPSGGPIWMLYEGFTGASQASLEGWFADFAGMAYSEAVVDGEPVSEEAREKLIAFYEECIDPLVEVDGNNVVMTIQKPFPPFMQILAHFGSWGAIFDSKVAMENGEWDSNADGWWKWHDLQPEESYIHNNDLGSGPFVLEEWDTASQRVVMSRFDDYWAGPAEIKEIIYWGVDEFSTRKAMLEAGDADVIYVPAQYIDQVSSIDGVRVISGYDSPLIVSLHFAYSLKPNSEYIGSGKLDGNGIPQDFFNDINCRKAISHSLNFDAFIDQVLNSLGRRVPTDLPAGFLGFDDSLPLHNFDLAKAEQSWKAAWDGAVWETGFYFQLLYNTGNEARQTAAEMIKVYTESLNPKFKIDVVGVNWPSYLKASRENLTPIYIIGWLPDYPDPHNFIYTYYHSKGVYGNRGGVLYREWARENVDDLIDKAIASTDPAEREALYLEVQKKVIDNYVGLPIYQPLGLFVEREWVKGWFPHITRSDLNYYQLSKGE